MFSLTHIIFLVISIIYIIAIVILTRNKTVSFSIRWFLYIGIISEIIKVFYYIVTNDNANYLPKTDLPFHLCSIQILFLIFLSLNQNLKIKRLLIAFMIPTGLFGGIAALLLPTSSSINGLLILSIQYFIYHSTLIAFSVNMMKQKEMEFAIKDVFNVLKFLGFMGFLAIYINSILGPESNVNFMYVVRPPMNGLPILNLNQGYIVYIIKYGLLAALLVMVSFSTVVYKSIASFKNKKNTGI